MASAIDWAPTPEIANMADIRVWLGGTGSPDLVPHRAGPSVIAEASEQVAIFDCGNGVTGQLLKLGYALTDVIAIFVTHHHVDHNADLGYVLVNRWRQGRGQLAPCLVVGPRGTRAFVDRGLALYDFDTRLRVAKDGLDATTLNTPVVEVTDGMQIDLGVIHVTSIRVEHPPVDEAFAFRIRGKNGSVVVSGDTRPNDNLVRQAAGADVLIHEVIAPFFGHPDYHTTDKQIARVAAQTEVSKLVLTHFLPGDRDDADWLQAIGTEFDGELVIGRDLLRVL